MKGYMILFVVLGLLGCEYETTPEDLVPGSGAAASSCEDSLTWTDSDGNPCSAFAALQEYCSGIAGAQDNCPVSCGLCVPEVADSTPEPGLEF